MIQITSFGGKWGLPPEAQQTYRVKAAIRNPFHLPWFQRRPGTDPEVQDYVMEDPQAQQLVLTILQGIPLPPPISPWRIAIGCRGGKHRSVAIACEVARRLQGQGTEVYVLHRDLDR